MIFGKKKEKEELKGDTIPKGVAKTLPRPTDEEIEKTKKTVDQMRSKSLKEPKVDIYFIQEISDRLYGPDSEEYVKAIKELNDKFRPREGKLGVDFYEPGLVDRIREKEKSIIDNIKGRD
jgi:hypothetical protein